MIVAALLSFVLVIRLAVRGVLPAWAVAILAPCTLLTAAVLFFRGKPRQDLWVVALGTSLALPMLGAFSLIDPWEAHYAEVAREMIERRDFVSPWWQDGWFMTKPVLTFWLEALAMVVFGVRTGPDGILAGGANPEWALRLPAFALALVGVYLLYDGVARTCGRRAGFLGALALWTMPGFALLAHQATTDMPLIGGVAASLGLLLRALHTPEGAQARGRGLAVWVALLTVPQLAVIALAPRHLVAGSPHACTLPGQGACAEVALAHPGFSPLLQVAFFLPLLIWLLVRIATETRLAHLLALGAWTAAAFAAMAKGPAGLAIPAAGAVLLCVSNRAHRLPEILRRLEIPTGLLLSVVMIGPWYLAIWARHGRGFLDELVMTHMIGRTLGHLHDVNDGEDVGLVYFVRQLGYATFPWSGLLAAAALSFPRREDGSRRTGARTLLFGAALFAFTLVSAMRTKFHHYVLPTVPPLAMLVGIWLDERLSEAEKPGRRRLLASAVLAFGAAGVLALVSRDLGANPSHLVKLFTYRYDRTWPAARAFAPVLVAVGALATLASLALAIRTWRRRAVIALGALAVGCTLVLLDGYLVRCAPNGGQRPIMDAYYRARTDTMTPLVAYELNWKGENFYTGNHLAVFMSGGSPMRTWLDARQRAGEHTFFFVTERSRIRGLRAELGPTRAFEELTDASACAEFTLVRAEL
ncbi:glycosyltransferase family 39 protein [Pendulispora brunnea]|uniref:Glycosyltransferase family 39 protein n=1 Tax=Pendulispora brunnea TaxID=2905690 RepID=A0ABZ2K9U7_9BACT